MKESLIQASFDGVEEFEFEYYFERCSTMTFMSLNVKRLDKWHQFA